MPITPIVLHPTDRFRNVRIYASRSPSGRWTLIDTGWPDDQAELRAACAAAGFALSDLESIVLTHTHADHAGCLAALVRETNVPVYVHPAELPRLLRGDNGPNSPIGLMSTLARLVHSFSGKFEPYARATRPLADGAVIPECNARVVHTPGHAAGHVSLLFPQDKVAIAADLIRVGPFVQRIHWPWVVDVPGGSVDLCRQSLQKLIAQARAAGVSKMWVSHSVPGDNGLVTVDQAAAFAQ